MATYYKGKLHLNSELNGVKAFLASYNSNLLIGPNFKKKYFSLTPKERQSLDNYLEEIIKDSISFKIGDDELNIKYQTIKGYNLDKYEYNYHSSKKDD